MKALKIYNSDDICVLVPVDQIECLVAPSGRVHDNGRINLISGRVIYLGNGMFSRLSREYEDAKA